MLQYQTLLQWRGFMAKEFSVPIEHGGDGNVFVKAVKQHATEITAPRAFDGMYCESTRKLEAARFSRLDPARANRLSSSFRCCLQAGPR